MSTYIVVADNAMEVIDASELNTTTATNSAADTIVPTVTNITDGGNMSTELYIVSTMLVLLSATGCAGNVLVLYVYMCRRQSTVSNLFILVLAVIDLISCSCLMPFTIYMEVYNYYIHWDILCKLYLFLITSNIPFSALIMVVIAVDRYLSICRPLYNALSLSRAKLIVLLLATLAIVIGTIVALTHGVYTRHVIMGNYVTASDVIMTSSVTQSVVSTESEWLQVQVVIYTGQCQSNELVFGSKFQWYYHKFYSSLYVVCLCIVLVLYTLIFVSVHERRTRHDRRHSRTQSIIRLSAVAGPEFDRITLLTCTGHQFIAAGHTNISDNRKTFVTFEPLQKQLQHYTTVNDSQQQQQQQRRQHVRPGVVGVAHRFSRASLCRASISSKTLRDTKFVANLKTAAMLFVVTLVFITTFTPAFLMVLQLVPYNIIVFNVYFANNVANPFIYSFMNQNFRDDLRRFFCRN